MLLRTLELTVDDEEIRYRYREKTPGGDFLKDTWPKPQKLNLGPASSRERIVSLVRLQRCLADTLSLGSLSPEDSKKFEVYLNEVTQFLGERLYIALFGAEAAESPLGVRLMEVLMEMVPEDLLRIELQFTGAYEEELVSWPWEYMFIPFVKGAEFTGQFLASYSQLVLTRRHYLTGETQNSALETDPPVKVLLVCASPVDLGRVQYESVLTKLRGLRDLEALELFELVAPPYPTSPSEKDPLIASFEAFEELLKKKPHIIHFIGHGRLHEGFGELAFMKSDGRPDWVRDFASAVKPMNSGNDLKLVFLQACESGLSDPTEPLSAVAHQCAHHNVPAIVAMQAKIQNETAGTFACRFYESLAEGNTVDFAVLQARQAIGKRNTKQQAAFGVPVLYLRGFGKLIKPRSASASDNRRSAHVTTKPASETPTVIVAGETVCPRCSRITPDADPPCCIHCGLRYYCLKCTIKLLNVAEAKFCRCGERLEQPSWEPQRQSDASDIEALSAKRPPDHPSPLLKVIQGKLGT